VIGTAIAPTLFAEAFRMPHHSFPSARIVRGAAVVALALATVSCAISQRQEVQLRADHAMQIDTQLPVVRDAQVMNYVTALGKSLAGVTDTRGLAWHFAVVDGKEVNAFAVPGGWVYVNGGLIARAQTTDQLAGVPGHKIWHVTLRHSVQQMQQSQQVGRAAPWRSARSRRSVRAVRARQPSTSATRRWSRSSADRTRSRQTPRA